MRRAEQRRRRQWVAQQPLQRRAGEAENGTNRASQDGARQPDFADDHLLHVATAAKQGIDHRQRRQPYRPDPKREQRQQHDKHNESAHHSGAPARRDISRHRDVLGIHQSSSTCIGIHAIGRQQNSCDENGALVQSGLQVRSWQARRRSLAVPRTGPTSRQAMKSCSPRSPNSTRKALFSSLSGSKDTPFAEQCMVG